MPQASGRAREFAFEHLDIRFAVLATFGTVMVFLVFPLALVVTLWVVSRAEDVELHGGNARPAARAQPLDLLQQAPGPSAHAAADAFATAAFYVLAVAGALVLIASLMYLITAGARQQARPCSSSIADRATRCRIASRCRPFGRGGVAGNAAGDGRRGSRLPAAIRAPKRLGGLSIADVLKRPDDRFLLYLRPFDTDNVILPKPLLPLTPASAAFVHANSFAVRIEEEADIRTSLPTAIARLIAVGKPGGSKEALRGGLAYRTYLEDSEWQGYVADKIRRAERIVMLVKDSEGVRWESGAGDSRGRGGENAVLRRSGDQDFRGRWQTRSRRC